MEVNFLLHCSGEDSVHEFKGHWNGWSGLTKQLKKPELLPNVTQLSYIHLQQPTFSFMVVLLSGALLLPHLSLFPHCNTAQSHFFIISFEGFIAPFGL